MADTIQEDMPEQLKEGDYYKELREKLVKGEVRHGVVHAIQSRDGEVVKKPLPKPQGNIGVNLTKALSQAPEDVKARIREALATKK